MRLCGSLGNTRTREIDGVGAMGLIISSNGGVGFVFLRAEYLGTLEVETTSIEYIPAFEVNENLVQNNMVTSTLSTTKLQFIFATNIAPNTTTTWRKAKM